MRMTVELVECTAENDVGLFILIILSVAENNERGTRMSLVNKEVIGSV